MRDNQALFYSIFHFMDKSMPVSNGLHQNQINSAGFTTLLAN